MLIATVLLACAVAVTLGWALWLRRQLRQRDATLPAPDPFSPLFHAVATAFDAGLVVVNHDLRVRYLNPQAAMLLNANRDAVQGDGLIALIRDYQIDALVRDVLRDGEAREMVLQPLVSGPTLRLRAAPLSTEQGPGAVLLVRDVTQLSMLERARRDMVANVSHELRTPLASVKLLVETVQSAPPPEVAQRMLTQMAQEVDAITQLVDELHDLSQIESGRVALQMTPSSLAPVVVRALERIRPQAERKALHISAHVSDQLPTALMDADRIGQVLLNLLHNAIKFTAAGGDISIRAQPVTIDQQGQQASYAGQRIGLALAWPNDQRPISAPLPPLSSHPPAHGPSLAAGDWMLVSVSDTGIGIPSRDLPRIFERFYKVDRSRTRNAGGTGLGLAIAKHLIEGHGGRIWATSQEGSGSTFYFVLPLA